MPYCQSPDGSVSFEVGSCPVNTTAVSRAVFDEYESAKETLELQEGATRNWQKLPVFSKQRQADGTYYGSTSTGSTGAPDSFTYIPDTAATYVNVPAQLWGSDPDQFKAMSQTLKAIPGFDNDGSVEEVTGKFEDFLEMLSRSGLQMDPYEGLNYFAQVAKAQGYKGPGGGGGGPRTTTTVALTNEFDAEALVNASLNSYLGRDATENEIEEFYKKLNKAERKNPRVTTTSKSGSFSRGGYNSQLAAEQYAETRDDYAETQAETTFKGLMERAIRGRMSGTLEGML